MYTSLFHSKPVPICTYLSLTGSWYKYAQISISQEAKTNTYKSLPHRKLVQVCSIKKTSPLPEAGKHMYKTLSHRNWYKLYKSLLSQEAGPNMYKTLSHRKPVPICKNLSPSGGWYKYVQISPSQEACTTMYKSPFTGSWYKYVQISISQEAVTNLYESLSHSKLV